MSQLIHCGGFVVCESFEAKKFYAAMELMKLNGKVRGDVVMDSPLIFYCINFIEMDIMLWLSLDTSLVS